MNERRPRPDDELLSAYFDGEVTQEERARVELLLGTSPAAKAEFEELGELSQLVKALPRPSAPPEVRTAAVRAAERKMQLAAIPVSPVRRSWLRDVVMVATGMLAAGVAVMVFPNLSLREHALRESVTYTAPAQHFHDMADGTTPVSLEKGRPDSDFRLRTAMRAGPNSGVNRDLDGMVVHSDQPAPATAPVLKDNDRSPSFGVAAGGAAASRASTVADPRSSGPMLGEADGVTALSKGDAVQQFTDALPYVSVANDTGQNVVMNVDLYVTDAQRSADRFRLYLNENGVVTDASVEDQAATKSLKPATVARSAEMKVKLEEEQLAIFVDAPADPVVRSLEQMSQLPELLGVRLRPPLELPLDAKDRTVREAPPVRAPVLDVELLDERIRTAYNEYRTFNVDLLNEELAGDSDLPVDALSALAGGRSLETQITQRTKNYNQRRFLRNSLDAPAPVTTEAVPPIPGVQFEANAQFNGINRLMKLPPISNSTTSDTQTYYANEPLKRAAIPQTNLSQLQADELRQRVWQDNNALFGNVRVLFVMQENAEAGRAISGGEAVAAPVAPPAASSPAPAAKK